VFLGAECRGDECPELTGVMMPERYALVTAQTRLGVGAARRQIALVSRDDNRTETAPNLNHDAVKTKRTEQSGFYHRYWQA